MVYELQRPENGSQNRILNGYYVKCSRCGYREPVRPGEVFATKLEADQAERIHNFDAHGIAPKGFIKP